MAGSEQVGQLSRRGFVRLASGVLAGGVVGTLLAACGPAAAPAATSAPPAPTAPTAPVAPVAPGTRPAASNGAGSATASGAQTAAVAKPKSGASLKILLWSHFVPAYDEWFDTYAKSWGSKNGVDVKVDHITNNTIPARLAAEAAAGGGHDLFEFQAVLQAATYKDKLVDLTDVAGTVSKKYGGWTETGKTFGVVEGKWLGVMSYAILQPHLYRKDYFSDVGYDKFPDDYLTLLDASAKMKEKGHVCGLPLSNCNDGNHNWRSVIYSFGGTEQSPDGQKVTIASDETLAAIKYGVELFNRGMTDEVFSWDDSGNNRLLLSGRGSWIDNATSAYITARKDAPDVFENSAIGLQPKGPSTSPKAGRRNGVDGNAWAVWKWANDADTAKAFVLDWYDQWQEWGKVTNGYNSPSLIDMWKKPMPGLEDPNFQIMQDWRDLSFVAGREGTFNAAIEEINATFVIPNMMARAVRGDTPDAAMKWAEGEYKRIFQAHGVANP
ncbi:MAG: extracellular solute-binding protein [Chloroflexota bacterium]